jgi:hypothetical protein
MPQVKDYVAKREMKLDCGHTVQAGEAYHVISVFTCDHEGRWPLNILLACFAVARRKQTQVATATSSKQSEEKRAMTTSAKATS